MQSPLISLPLKQTDEVDWIQPLKKSIQKFHGTNPEKYTEECALLQRLRQNMRGAGKDNESSRDLLYRYCGQLEFLERRFTVDESNVKISFTWYDAFTQKPTTQYSLAYEKASVIFNIAAILSCNAAARNRDAEDDLKKVWHELQLAAGMLRYLNENFQYAPSTDLDRNTVSTLDTIMLAQAQEAFFERQVRRKTKVLMVAKLAGHAASLWAQTVEGVQDNVTKGIFDKSWLILVQCKAALFASLSQHYQAMADTSGEKGKVPDYGAQITRLQVAFKQAAEARTLAKSFPKSCPEGSNLGPETGSALLSITEKHWTTIKETLEEAKNDNDKIYHQVVPSETSLAAVETLSSANPTRISKAEIDQIIGADIFWNLVPMWVVESASVYEAQKDEIKRKGVDAVRYAKRLFADFTGKDELDSLLDALKGGASKETLVFKEFKDWCEKIGEHPYADRIVSEMAQKESSLTSTLDQACRKLDEEERVCEKLRLQYGGRWTQQPSSELAAVLREDIEGCRSTMEVGRDRDAKLAALCRNFDSQYNDMRSAGMEMLSQGRTEKANILFQHILNKTISSEGSRGGRQSASVTSNLIDEEFDDRGRTIPQQVKDLDEARLKLNDYEQSLEKAKEDLNTQTAQDNIYEELVQDISNKKAITDVNHPFFVERLKQYEEPLAILDELVEQYAHEIRILDSLYRRLRQDKRIRQDVAKIQALNKELERQRGKDEARAQEGTISFEMENMQQGITNARNFYTNMQESIDNISQNVATFVSNRESERNELLDRLSGQPGSSTNAPSAERDQARLNNLMGRMKLSSPPPLPPAPSSHNRPAPLQNIPSYHQAYNPAKSPPLSGGLPQPQHASLPSPYGAHSQQQRYAHPGGASSNANFGYNPTHYGPVSPPPQQQTFGHNPSNSRSYQQSPPNAHHQSVPAGFVPPPPPPGPPPNNATSMRNDNDPWGGLSGWK